MQATRVFSCPPAKVSGRTRRVAKGWRTCCKPAGAASGDFTALSAVFPNARGRKASCGASGAGCSRHSCPPFEGGHGEEETQVALLPTQTQPVRGHGSPAPPFMKQPWSSREQFLVWEWIQSIAECFSAMAPASGLVISPAALLLPSSSSPDTGAGFFPHSHFCRSVKA